MNEAFNDLLFWMIMAGLWWLWFVEYRQYNLNRTRQKLFKIRDQFFMDAVEGNIPMDSTAYKMLRSMLHGSIRFTENLSIFRMAKIVSVDKKHKISDRYESNLANALKQLDGEQRKLVHDSLEKMNDVLIHHLIHGNLVLLVVVELARLHSTAIDWVHATAKKRLRNTRRALDARVLNLGVDDESDACLA